MSKSGVFAISDTRGTRSPLSGSTTPLSGGVLPAGGRGLPRCAPCFQLDETHVGRNRLRCIYISGAVEFDDRPTVATRWPVDKPWLTAVHRAVVQARRSAVRAAAVPIRWRLKFMASSSPCITKHFLSTVPLGPHRVQYARFGSDAPTPTRRKSPQPVQSLRHSKE